MGHITTHKCGDTADTLRNVRAGCSVRLKVRITDGGVALNWDDPLLSIGEVAVWSQARQGLVGRPTFSVDADDPTLLDVLFTTGAYDLPGPHRLLVTVKYNGWTAVHTVLAYNLIGSVYGTGAAVSVSEEGAEETDVDVLLELHDIDTTYLQCLIDSLVRLRVDESERLTTLEVLTEGLRTDVNADTADIEAHGKRLDSLEESDAAQDTSLKAHGKKIRALQEACATLAQKDAELEAAIAERATKAELEAEALALSQSIAELTKAVDSAVEELEGKQDAFEAGYGLTLEGGVLSVTIDTSLYVLCPDGLPDGPYEGKEDKVYLVPMEETEEGNAYAEYLWADGSWELFGTLHTKVDLSGYCTTEEAARMVEAAAETLAEGEMKGGEVEEIWEETFNG